MNKKLFKTELHCHSKEVSTCANEGADVIVPKYLKYGYSTLVITNHLSLNCHSTDYFAGKSWEEKAEHFIEGYRAFKKVADGTGLNIIFGAEIRFPQYFNDYLLFGLTEEYLLSHENIYCTDVATFHEQCKRDGLLLIQAHPFRQDLHIISRSAVDGYEVYNGHPFQEGANKAAFEYGKSVPGAILTSGTDHHGTNYYPAGGIMTGHEIKTSGDLLSTLRSGNYFLIADEDVRTGKKRL